jgi:hypothetical protein
MIFYFVQMFLASSRISIWYITASYLACRVWFLTLGWAHPAHPFNFYSHPVQKSFDSSIIASRLQTCTCSSDQEKQANCGKAPANKVLQSGFTQDMSEALSCQVPFGFSSFLQQLLIWLAVLIPHSGNCWLIFCELSFVKNLKVSPVQ